MCAGRAYCTKASDGFLSVAHAQSAMLLWAEERLDGGRLRTATELEKASVCHRRVPKERPESSYFGAWQPAVVERDEVDEVRECAISIGSKRRCCSRSGKASSRIDDGGLSVLL